MDDEDDIDIEVVLDIKKSICEGIRDARLENLRLTSGQKSIRPN